MIDLVLDMETQDPDDFLTLLLLLDHPQVHLKAVTLTPGSTQQVGLVRQALSWFGRADLPVGAHNLEHPKPCVSSWHQRAFGPWEPSGEARPGWEVLAEHCDLGTTLVTGAPLKNLGQALLREPSFLLGRWVAQGGFAGQGVVPEPLQLPKFKGMRTCPTFNLNGAPQAALLALEHPGIRQRRFVSKNVCHGVLYDEAFHRRLEPHRDRRRGLSLIWQGMDTYLRHKRVPRMDEAIEAEQVRLLDRHGQHQGLVPLAEALRQARGLGLHLVERPSPQQPPLCRIQEHPGGGGKKLHDPLAACCAIDPRVGVWERVDLYREKNAWGARLNPDASTQIIIDYDPERFFDVLTAQDPA